MFVVWVGIQILLFVDGLRRLLLGLVWSFLVLFFNFSPPLDFHGRVRVVKSMYLPAALHGIEASLLASDSLRKLRSAVRRVVWSRRQPLASVGAPSIWDTHGISKNVFVNPDASSSAHYPQELNQWSSSIEEPLHSSTVEKE